MSNLLKHARKELELIGAFDEEKDFYEGMTGNAVMELIEVFAKQGHSGMSASLVRQLFNRCADYQPLSPLTGEESEWAILDHGDDMYAQNKRCGSVFKRKNGTAYHSDKRVFREKDGGCYTNKDSSVDITFPYMPETEYIER